MKHVEKTDEIWNAHSLYNTKLSEEFQVMKSFLDKYPSEVVIIFLNGGWYEMNDSLYQKLNEELDM